MSFLKTSSAEEALAFQPTAATVRSMQTVIVILVAFVRAIVLSRAGLQLENIALRQQVAVLRRDRPRPQLRPLDRLFWVYLFRLWPSWKDALVIVVSGVSAPGTDWVIE